MNIGIRLHDTLPGTLAERLHFAQAQGFGCVQLAMSKSVPGFAMRDAPKLLTEDLALRIRSEMDDCGIECAVLGCYLKLASADEEERAFVQEIYAAHLRFAGWIGARVVGTETPPSDRLGWTADDLQKPEALQLQIDCLRPLVRRAEEEGSILAVEPVVSHIVSTAEKAQQILDALPSPNLKIILDPVNLLSSADLDRAEEIVDDAVARLGDQVMVLHMKDYLPDPEKSRPRPVACGRGMMRYDSLLRFALKHDLPMTLENTTPENAEETRLYLEQAANLL